MTVIPVNGEEVEPVSCDELTTGISNPALSDNITMYPNPASGTLTINVLGGENRIERVRLLDITGKEVLTKRLFCE